MQRLKVLIHQKQARDPINKNNPNDQINIIYF